MIENILNNYFSKKLIKCFKTCAWERGIDLRIIPRKNIIIIYAKDRRFISGLYKNIFTFNKENSVYYLCNLLETKKEFKNILKEYQKKEVQ